MPSAVWVTTPGKSDIWNSPYLKFHMQLGWKVSLPSPSANTS